MKSKIAKYLVTFTLGLLLAFIIVVLKDIFHSTSVKDTFHILTDAFFVPGVLIACFGVLVIATNGGTFDMLAYGVMQFFNLFRKDPTNRKYKTFYDYKKAQEDKQIDFWYLIIVGAILIGISLIFLAIYNNK